MYDAKVPHPVFVHVSSIISVFFLLILMGSIEILQYSTVDNMSDEGGIVPRHPTTADSEAMVIPRTYPLLQIFLSST